MLYLCHHMFVDEIFSFENRTNFTLIFPPTLRDLEQWCIYCIKGYYWKKKTIKFSDLELELCSLIKLDVNPSSFSAYITLGIFLNSWRYCFHLLNKSNKSTTFTRLLWGLTKVMHMKAGHRRLYRESTSQF